MSLLPFLQSLLPSTDETVEMPMNVYDTSNSVVIIADLPGVQKKDISIKLNQYYYLTISVTRTHPVNNYSRTLIQDIHPNQYSRTIRLPKYIDVLNFEVGYNDGMLTITFAKKIMNEVINIPID